MPNIPIPKNKQEFMYYLRYLILKAEEKPVRINKFSHIMSLLISILENPHSAKIEDDKIIIEITNDELRELANLISFLQKNMEKPIEAISH